nr:hypothetical protein BaRGS_002430 [Batillaria attramentaria]
MTRLKDEPDSDLPTQDQAKEFYAKYEPRDILGKGISSTVRRVVEKKTGKEYAVKIIDISGEKGESDQVEQTKRETMREVSILRMCAGHPNIIELHDFFETPTFIFLVFELCKKGELFDYLTQVVSLSEKRTRIFMRQLLDVVHYLHSHHIVHRDLKPENILLDDDLNLKVSDFGFATLIQNGEELTELCGTPGYLAPEVLSVSMYENVAGYGLEVDMLCGSPPFWHRKQMMMLRAIMQGSYHFNSPEWDDITDAPKDLIRNLLVVDPKQRYTAAQALEHPFFKRESAIFCVRFFFRLKYYYYNPPPVSIETVLENPYGVKAYRKLIDGCAFGMYAHWVKRGDNQNRAALFEHALREDWKNRHISL